MTRTRPAGYAAESIDELPTLWDGFAKLVRAGLDITAFGANIMDLPPDYSTTVPRRVRVTAAGALRGSARLRRG